MNIFMPQLDIASTSSATPACSLFDARPPLRLHHDPPLNLPKLGPYEDLPMLNGARCRYCPCLDPLMRWADPFSPNRAVFLTPSSMKRIYCTDFVLSMHKYEW